MRWLHRVLAPLPFVASAGLVGACGRESAAILLGMTVPQGLLDTASSVELRVIPSGASCDPTDGRVSGDFDEDSVQAFDLEKGGCPGGAVWCKDVTVEQSGETQVFEVRVTANQEISARGCTAVVVDQDPLDVGIDVVPNFAAACCNDGVVQIGEHCDSGAVSPTNCQGQPTNNAVCGALVDDPVCHCDCLAREIVLSSRSIAPDIGNEPNSKVDPAFAFAGVNAEGGIPSSFRAVFTDNTTGDINLRVLTADLMPAPDVLSQQLHLPQDCETMNAPVGPAFAQITPDIARLDDNLMLVAFADDRRAMNTFDIRVIVQDAWACNDVSPPSPAVCSPACMGPTIVSGGGNHRLPAVAGGPSSTALVVWVDGGPPQGRLQGRIWVPGADENCSTCLPAMPIDFGVSITEKPRVTGHANGFVVAYSASNNVFVRPVAADGTLGAETKVNNTDGAHDQPAVAALPDGRFAVVWRNDARLLFQRFGADGTPVAGDQDQVLTVNSPRPFEPQLAAAQTGASFWAAVWVAEDSTAWARYIDDTDRFLRNPNTGRLDDFLVSHPATAGAARYTPDVAIGGNGWVAFGWSDVSPEPGTPDARGIRVRRFPLPE